MNAYLNPLPTFAAVAVILVIVLSACSAVSAPGSSSAPSPTRSPANGPIVTIETQGGECMQGACGGVVVIESCEVIVDPTNPLFAAVDAALSGIDR